MKLYSFTLEEGLLPHELFTALSAEPYAQFFDSADSSHELGRYSYIVYRPIETIESKDGRVTVTNREQQLSFDDDIFSLVNDRLSIYGLSEKYRDDLPPFQGGAMGYFGYDLVRGIEKIPEQTNSKDNVPDSALGIYHQVYAYDHKQNKSWFIVHATDEREAKAQLDQFLLLSQQVDRPITTPQGDSEWQAKTSRNDYEAMVQKVIDYIYAGDIFQANLSQRFEAVLPKGFDSWEHYLTLRNVNAAPYAAYQNFGAIKIASTSPERFLHADRRHIETRPIKGTALRQDDEAIDQLYRNSLENSTKDRAENTMIVDLLRNDLSKVCEDHSIEVTDICALESFAKVHHLVSTVKGILKANKTVLDLLKACFPGGSITGAPKVRAMEIIEELETERRGPYCGTIAYIGFNGAMDSNITIRTLVYEGNQVSFNVGGGIVADSNPSEEYQETMAKAEAIFKSFEIYTDEDAEKIA